MSAPTPQGAAECYVDQGAFLPQHGLKGSRYDAPSDVDEVSFFPPRFASLSAATRLCTLVSPSLPRVVLSGTSCRRVVRIETASFLSATGVGPFFTITSGVFTARQMKIELLTVCVRSRIQNELRDSHLLHERLPPSCLLVVLLHGHHLGVIPVVSGYRSARPATEAPDHVHCYLRGRRCTAAPNVT